MARSSPVRASVLLATVTLGLFIWFWTAKGGSIQEEQLRIAFTPAMATMLVTVAQERGFFRECGLRIIPVYCRAGLYALDTLVRGEADLAVASEYPYALRNSLHRDLFVVCSLSSFRQHGLLVSRRSGIGCPADLRGRRIGLTRSTSGEYFLMDVLLFNDMDESDVKMVDLSSTSFGDALGRGEVDAVSTWFHNIHAVTERLGDEVSVWSAHDNLETYMLSVVGRGLIEERPRAIEKYLDALVRAERFVRTHPEEAKRIVLDNLGLDRGYIDKYWSLVAPDVALDQALVSVVEGEAAWAERSGRLPGKLFNPLDFFHVDGLARIRPASVTIFR